MGCGRRIILDFRVKKIAMIIRGIESREKLFS